MRWAAIIALCALTLSACQARDVTHPDARDAFARARQAAPSSAPIVARVNGQALTLTQLDAYWQTRPELSAEQALDGLINQTLIIARAAPTEAQAHALHDARKRGLTRAWLEREVDAQPLGELTQLDAIRATLRQQARTPAGIRASHLLLLVQQRGKDPVTGADVTMSDADYQRALERAKARAVTLRAELPERPEPHALLAFVEARRDALQAEGFTLVANLHMSFPRPGEAYEGRNVPEGWMNVAPEFAQSAAAQLDGAGPGTLSGPVITPFGVHLILPEVALPAQEPAPDALDARARFEAARQHRSATLQRALEAAASGAEVVTAPQVLSAASGG